MNLNYITRYDFGKAQIGRDTIPIPNHALESSGNFLRPTELLIPQSLSNSLAQNLTGSESLGLGLLGNEFAAIGPPPSIWGPVTRAFSPYTGLFQALGNRKHTSKTSHLQGPSESQNN